MQEDANIGEMQNARMSRSESVLASVIAEPFLDSRLLILHCCCATPTVGTSDCYQLSIAKIFWLHRVRYTPGNVLLDL